MTERILVYPDLQAPFHDRNFLKKLNRVAASWQPTKVCIIGDLCDSPEVGRWTKASAGEYAPTLQTGLDAAYAALKSIREAAPKAAITWKLGNHDERLEKYINDYAPALRSLRSSDIGYQLRCAELGVRLERSPFLLAPGVLAVHGHERAYSSVSGRYEMERIKQYGLSVVAGHTHTPTLVTYAQGHGFKQKHFFGMNVGHGMDVKKVSYTKDGMLGWTQAFGALEVSSRGTVHPTLTLAPGGKFVFAGEEF